MTQEQIEKGILELQDAMRKHQHKGYDYTMKIGNPYTITWNLPGTVAVTPANYGVIMALPFSIEIIGATEVHTSAATDAGAVTLQIEKLTGTQALDAGTTLLATAFNLKATADTVQTGALTTTKADLIVKTGDRLALKDAGALTALAGVSVTILARII